MIYGADSFDGTNNFDICDHSVLALFPSHPTANDGTIIVCTEVGFPYSNLSTDGLDQVISDYHKVLLDNITLAIGIINAWDNNPSNVNQDCSIITSLEEMESSAGIIYPNPAIDHAFIPGSFNEQTKISLYDLSGREFSCSVILNAEGASITWDRNMIGEGRYLLVVNESGGISTHSIYIR